jgi:hypothetical protein
MRQQPLKEGDMKRGLAVLWLFLVLAGCTGDRNPNASRFPSATPTGSPTQSPAPVVPTPGEPRLSVVYGVGAYSRHGFYQVTVSDSQRNIAASELFGPFYNYGSPDGRFIARGPYYQDIGSPDHADLTVADSATPGMMKRIHRVRGAQITSILWSADSNTLFYITSRYSGEEIVSRVYRIFRNGQDGRLIRSFNRDSGLYRLLAANLSDQLLYVADSEGKIEEIDLTTGRERPLKGTSISAYGSAFSPDAQQVFYEKNNNIVERTLSNGTDRVLFRGRRASNILGVSPQGDALTFDELTSTGAPDRGYILSLTTSQATPLRYGSRNGTKARWAPDGMHLWFECACAARGLSRGVIHDLTTRRSVVLGDGHHEQDDYASFIIWLVA